MLFTTNYANYYYLFTTIYYYYCNYLFIYLIII